MKITTTREIRKKYYKDINKILNTLVEVVKKYLEYKHADSYKIFIDTIKEEAQKKVQSVNIYITEKTISEVYQYKEKKFKKISEEDKYIIVFIEDKIQKFAKVAKGHRIEFIIAKENDKISKIKIKFNAYKKLNFTILQNGKVKTNVSKKD